MILITTTRHETDSYWDTPWAISLNNTFLPEFLKKASPSLTTALFGKWQ